ncbi:MAG: LysM peptidoglycan-binding domain-containing protein, partial [Trebonia sp.]
MAPPIPGLRSPLRRQRRTFADVAIGVLAVILLAALTIGVPFALTMFLGLPIPKSAPSISLLTGQISVMTILKLLSVVVWLAWLQLLWCVIVEIRAAVRNVGVPARVPLSGGTQSVVHRLVTAALLLFSVTAALSPAFSHVAPPRPVHSVSAQAQLPGQPGGAGTATGIGVSVNAGHTTQATQATQHEQKLYTVSPPHGRYHESLWEVAQHHLGNGRRYKEIFELNKNLVQPDGSKLTIASLIRPGWVLRMPGDAFGPGIQTVSQHGHQAPPQQAAGQGQGLTAAQLDGNGGAVGAATSRSGGGSAAAATGTAAAGQQQS